jgi:hypothetical protein
VHVRKSNHRASSAICPSNQARSRFHAALSGERLVTRTMIARPCRKASSAIVLSLAFLNAPASLAYATDRLRCQRALPGSDFAPWSARI